jgi:hypothetical protein
LKRALLLGFGAGLGACQANQSPVPDEDVTPPLACLPDRDGSLTHEELPVAIGATVDTYVGSNRTVDLSGPDWDLSREEPDDDIVAIGPVALGAQWYAGAFLSSPGAGQFVTDGPAGLDAVYHLDAQGLWLHGLASVTPDQTRLVYDEPVAVLRLPLAAGDAWTAVGRVSAGTLDGLPYIGSDTYEIGASDAGTLHLPYVRFRGALPVATHVTVRPDAGGVSTSRRQVSFLFECFGEIARAESRADEPDEAFTNAASLRRFAL